MEATDLARKTAEIASRDVAARVRETSKNRGKRIEQYQATVGAKTGAAYCIAAICTWVKEACNELQCKHEILFSPSCLRFLEYAKKTAHAFLPSELKPEMIPCIGIIDHGKGLGHAVLIIGMDDFEDGGGTKLATIEANTGSGDLSRDGDGVYAKNVRLLVDLVGCVRIA